jgi:hypothetical protein
MNQPKTHDPESTAGPIHRLCSAVLHFLTGFRHQATKPAEQKAEPQEAQRKDFDVVEEASEESFPASDPPGWY